MRRYCTAIHVEGIGAADGTGAAGGTLFATPNSMLLSAGDAGFDWTPRLKMPSSGGEDSTDPFSARFSRSSFQFELHGHDDVVEMFLHEAIRAAGELQAEVTAAATTIDAGVSGLAGAVYLEQETIILGADQGDGTYTGCTRGAYGSRATPHVVGVNVYDEVREWPGRVVTLYTYFFKTGHLEPRWRGKISPQSDIEQRAMVLHLPCTVADAGNEQVRLGRFQPTVRTEFAYRELAGARDIVGQKASFLTPTVTKPTATEQAAGYYSSALQIGHEVVKAHVGIESDDEYRFVNLDGGVLLRSNSEIEPIKNQGGPLFTHRTQRVSEVFAVDKRQNFSSIYALDEVGATWYKYHPAAIWACLKLSTGSDTADPDNFDVLRGPWAMDAAWQFEDDIVSTVWTLIDETPYLARVEQLVLGYDQQPAAIERELQQLLRNHGLMEGINPDGTKTLRRLGLPDIDIVATALDNEIAPIPSDRLGQASGRSSSVDTVEAIIGKLPWQDGEPYEIDVRDSATFRSSKLQQNPDTRVDFTTIPRDRPRMAVSLLESTALVQNRALARVPVRVNDHVDTGADLTVGGYCTIADLPLKKPYLVDHTGTRISTTSGNVMWLCQIIGREYLPGKRAYNLTLLVMGGAVVRWRAPAAEISGYTDYGDGTSRFDITEFAWGGQGALQKSDGDRFTAGDDIMVTTKTGALYESTIFEVTAATSTSLTVTGTLSAGAPSSGWDKHILELAHLDTDASGEGYANDGLAGAYPNIHRIYVFLAQSPTSPGGTASLGDVDADADVYG